MHMPNNCQYSTCTDEAVQLISMFTFFFGGGGGQGGWHAFINSNNNTRTHNRFIRFPWVNKSFLPYFIFLHINAFFLLAYSSTYVKIFPSANPNIVQSM